MTSTRMGSQPARAAWRGIAIALALGWSAMGAGPLTVGPGRAQDALSAASSDTHLWMLVDTVPAVAGARIGARLLHVALDLPASYAATPDELVLPQSPQGLAAWGDQLWIVGHPRQQAGGALRRDVFAARVERNAITGMDHFVPYDQLGVAPALPGVGLVAGFVGTGEGPVALLLPAQKDVAGVQARDTSAAAEPGLDRPALLQLRRDKWVELALPEGFDASQGARLGAGGLNRRILWLFTSDFAGEAAPESERGGMMVQRRDSDGRWLPSRLPIALSHVRSVTAVGSEVALVIEGDAGDQGPIQVAYVIDSHIVPIASLARPTGRWNVVGLRDGLRVVERVGSQEPSVSRIDSLTGEVGPRQVLEPQPRTSRQFLLLPLLATVGMTALLGWALFRPTGDRAQVVFRPGTAHATPPQRLAALAVDLLPAGLLTMLALQSTFADLIRLPSFNLTISAAVPSIVLSTITVAHAAVGEMLTGRSLGKAMVGLRVASTDGSPARAWQIVVRNLFKLIALWIPPLGLLALVNPDGQGIGDRVSRTVVLREIDETPSPRGEDES